MMGRQTGDQSQLFYLFNLEERIPANHLLRRINPIVTRVLADLREKLAPFYSDIGRPSIDPELVRLKVDVIVTHNTPTTLAAKQATSVIPIVFATAGDPVGTGIVASLARPGGNVTGLSSQSPDAAGKRLQLLRELVPGLQRLAILTDVANPFTELTTTKRSARHSTKSSSRP